MTAVAEDYRPDGSVEVEGAESAEKPQAPGLLSGLFWRAVNKAVGVLEGPALSVDMMARRAIGAVYNGKRVEAADCDDEDEMLYRMQYEEVKDEVERLECLLEKEGFSAVLRIEDFVETRIEPMLRALNGMFQLVVFSDLETKRKLSLDSNGFQKRNDAIHMYLVDEEIRILDRKMEERKRGFTALELRIVHFKKRLEELREPIEARRGAFEARLAMCMEAGEVR